MNNELIVFPVIAIAMFGLVSALHYQGLSLISRIPVSRLAKPHMPLLIVPALAVLHMTEIFLYAFLYFSLEKFMGFGGVVAADNTDFLDYLYHSISCFTTLGLTDLVPDNPFRILSGTEALAGFMMITWSASFLYAAFPRFWGD